MEPRLGDERRPADDVLAVPPRRLVELPRRDVAELLRVPLAAPLPDCALPRRAGAVRERRVGPLDLELLDPPDARRARGGDVPRPFADTRTRDPVRRERVPLDREVVSATLPPPISVRMPQRRVPQAGIPGRSEVIHAISR
jgi:hypothetical protein